MPHPARRVVLSFLSLILLALIAPSDGPAQTNTGTAGSGKHAAVPILPSSGLGVIGSVPNTAPAALLASPASLILSSLSGVVPSALAATAVPVSPAVPVARAATVVSALASASAFAHDAAQPGDAKRGISDLSESLFDGKEPLQPTMSAASADTGSASQSFFPMEPRSNDRLRRDIKRWLREKGRSKAPPDASEPRTRGGTRGGSRGTDNRVELPPDVRQYDYLFSQVIPAELDLPYGREDDPQSHVFFRRDPDSREKIDMMEELGIRWDSQEAPQTAPTWMEFARNYRAALARREIDPSSTLVPAIVLYRDLGEVHDPKTGAPKMSREYILVDPLKERFPEDMSRWKVLDKDVQFNIPYDAIFDAIKQGKFPLLDAVHDVSHFVSFLRFPELGQSIFTQARMMASVPASRAFKLREYWLTEALSVLDPGSEAENRRFLGKNGRPTAARSVVEIEKELKRLDEKQLVDYSYKLARHFESRLRDVSGGNSNAAEKWFYLSESFGMKAEDLLNEDLSRSNPIGQVADLAKTYFENGPVTLNANPKKMTNETATFNFLTFVTAQKLLALAIRNGSEDDRISRKEARDYLLKFTSRTEHLMTLKPFSYREWCVSFLQNDLPSSDPIARMLTAVFGNDLISKLYLGVGALRKD